MSAEEMSASSTTSAAVATTTTTRSSSPLKERPSTTPSSSPGPQESFPLKNEQHFETPPTIGPHHPGLRRAPAMAPAAQCSFGTDDAGSPFIGSVSDVSANANNSKKVAKEAHSFSNINEHPVDDISLEIFYKPHRLTLLLFSVAAVMTCAFVRNDSDPQANIWSGMLCAAFFFLIVSVLAFPNGPFTRPHPAVWRILFGVSVLYLLGVQFLMFQNYDTIKGIMYWFDPRLRDFHIDMDKEYAVGCNEVTLSKLWQYVDVYAASHFFGCFVKALLVRHMGVLWTISLMWEFTEMAFAHLLPNFLECWWDSFVLDVLVCNGLGYWCGMRVCRMFEMRDYRWESIRDISTTSGKIKRAVLQFTPGSWSNLRWFDTGGEFTYGRFWGVCQLVMFCQVTELNTFFLKHVFELPASHALVVTRLVLVGLFVAPSVRQYYVYITDAHCKRLGTQCWVYGAIMVSEAVLCVKNARELFSRTQARNVLAWLALQALMSVVCVYGCVLWSRYRRRWSEQPQQLRRCVETTTAQTTGERQPPPQRNDEGEKSDYMKRD